MRWATGTDGGADAAGNLTYDGRHEYTYDAWNRIRSVGQAYRDSNGTVQSGYAVGTYWYDGLHRRTRQVSNSAHGSFLQIRVYDTRWRPLEDLHWGGYVRRQYVWGARYIDELIQIGVNTDANDDCDAFYYAATNANFNVIGLIDDANGALVERHEYTPYGRRTVYAKSGLDDWLTSAPMWHSQLVPGKPYTLNDIGHQGLMHDRESGFVYSRMRYLNPTSGRFMQRDTGRHIPPHMDRALGRQQATVPRDPIPALPSSLVMPGASRSLGKLAERTSPGQCATCLDGADGLSGSDPAMPLADVARAGALDEWRRLIGKQRCRQGTIAISPRPAIPSQYEDGMNLYAYVGGNPVVYRDPSGRLKWVSTAYGSAWYSCFSTVVLIRSQWCFGRCYCWGCPKFCPSAGAFQGVVSAAVKGSCDPVCSTVFGNPLESLAMQATVQQIVRAVYGHLIKCRCG